MKKLMFFISLTLFASSAFSQELLKGFVGEKDEKGNEHALAGANVYWVDASHGTTTDTNGSFTLPFVRETKTLVVRRIGYHPDTLIITDQNSIHIYLNSETHTVEEVNVVGERKSSYLEYNNPFEKNVITEKELLKAACCNLSESFQTNPSVDVTFTDAITGTKQIEMLGLSGIYTQTTMENMPYIRGLTSNFGLSFVPGTWIQTISVSKGIGSVANGYESITGQIDIDMRKPDNKDENRFFLNIYNNQDRRIEANLNVRNQLSSRLSSMTLFHMSSQQYRVDENSDGYLDMPLFTTFNILQRWNFTDSNGTTGQLGVQYVNDKKDGGTVIQSSPNAYHYGTNNDLLRVHGKTGYIFSQNNDRSIGLQWSLSRYHNVSRFGTREYNGEERSGYINILYQSSLAGTSHKFRTGVSFLFDQFDETFNLISYRRIERVPGIFFEYTFDPDEKLSIIAGIRADEHNAYGIMLTPRLHIRYTPQENWVLRLAAGRGYRTANIFAENSNVFASSRTVSIEPTGTFGYGLKQEIAWNYGFNLTHYFQFNDRESTVLIDIYRTIFEQSILADLDSDLHQVRFYSVPYGSYSNSLQIETNIQPFERFDTRIAYRYLDVKQKLNGIWRERPLTAQHRILITLSYSTEHGQPERSYTSFDITMQLFGKKRIPETAQNPDSLQARIYSPNFATMNMQITRTFNKGFDIYLGAENIFGFKQSSPILDGTNPNGPFFDASLIWGPLSGRMVYAGLRLRI